VSPTTVSNVLHGRTGRMAPETLQKVQSILDQTRYVSNMGAQILGRHGSRLIALIIAYYSYEKESLLEDPFVGSIMGSVEQTIRENGYFMMLYNNPDMDECLQMARAWNIEGMILLGAQRQDYYRMRRELKIPVVSIDSCYRRDDRGYVNVGLQDYEGGRIMTEYLISQGHKKIGYLALMQNGTDPSVVYLDSARLKGYEDAMRNHGLAVKKEWVTKLSTAEEERDAQVRQLARRRFDGCTALFFGSDAMALEAAMVFRQEGFRVPEDISVAGFDNIRLASRLSPSLATVDQNFEQKGRCAVCELLKLMRDPGYSSDIRLPVRLVPGESVRRIG